MGKLVRHIAQMLPVCSAEVMVAALGAAIGLGLPKYRENVSDDNAQMQLRSADVVGAQDTRHGPGSSTTGI
jgi:hypothetical protein